MNGEQGDKCVPTSNPMSPARAGLVLRLREWSRNCLIDGLKMDRGEPTLQALLSEAAAVLMRLPDETTVTNSPLAQAVLDRVVGANLGIFLTSAVDHIEKGGNLASAEVELTDGTKVELRMSRVSCAGNHAPSCAAHDGKRCNCGIGSPEGKSE